MNREEQPPPKGGTTNFTNYSMPLISPNILGNKYIATRIV